MSVQIGTDNDYGYLSQPYLSTLYAMQAVSAVLPMQVVLNTTSSKAVKSSVVNSIKGNPKALNASVYTFINDQKNTLMQVSRVLNTATYMQVRKVLYNTFNLRILWDIASRGVSGNNWTVISPTALPGDFGVNNLNTDIVEEQFRTETNVNVQIQCDTEVASGVYVDTLAILNHNMSVSGSITVASSNEPTFSNPSIFELQPDGTDSIIWVSPTLPQTAYRYWRFTFTDSVSGGLAIGAILFGSAAILEGENVVSTITKTPKHFADKVQTEGFTAVSNDRALKNSISLEFRNLDYLKSNYELLKQIFTTCRTSLKALWIPTPRTPTRFAVFGKLAAIPAEQHNAISDDADYVSFSVEIDEAL